MSILTLDIEKPTAGGRMLARHNGQVVLVWGAIPGERVRARIERTAKGVIFAETIEVLSASSDRRDGIPDWRCGGNVLSHVSYPRQLTLKSEIIGDAFGRIGRVTLPDLPVVVGSPEHGYRMRARLHVRSDRIGFLREGSHDLCPVEPTGQLLAAAVNWLTTVEEQLRRDRLIGLTSIEVAENVGASERSCHLELDRLGRIAAFRGFATEAITGLSVQAHDSLHVEQLFGVPFVSDVVHPQAGNPSLAVSLRRDVRAFFQGNRYLLDSFVQDVMLRVTGERVVDLYAGVGLFGLSCAARGSSDVILVEGDAVGGRCLEENARPFVDRTRVYRSSVEDFLSHRTPHAGATFVVDPPRTGISRAALEALIRSSPEQIVYVSCDVATLARDVRILLDSGYSLGDVRAFDLFPNTAHVETICTLARSLASGSRP